MTDKEKTRVGIFINRFRAIYKDINPYTRGGEVWRDWYSTHSRNEPIPEELLPTDEELRHFDIMEARFVASQLANHSEYSTLLAYGDSVIGTPIEVVVHEVIAGARPCGCKEAQCSFFCRYYGMENCYGEENL